MLALACDWRACVKVLDCTFIRHDAHAPPIATGQFAFFLAICARVSWTAFPAKSNLTSFVDAFIHAWDLGGASFALYILRFATGSSVIGVSFRTVSASATSGCVCAFAFGITATIFWQAFVDVYVGVELRCVTSTTTNKTYTTCSKVINKLGRQQ